MGAWMKSAVSVALVGLMAVALAGCGNTMRDYLEHDTPQQQAAVRQDLSMPPDMRLPPPSSEPVETAAVSAEPNFYDDGSATASAPVVPAARPTPAMGIYEQAGISLTKPDGTKKTDQELREELRLYHIAKKKQANPNYGSVFNIGNIFKDE
jgi:hypothetical protein